MRMIDATEFLAEEFAREKHNATGVMYNDKPYFDGHVTLVRGVLNDFGFTSGVWGARANLHDVLEDCGVTREELREKFGWEVELPVFCVSGFGETRKIRNADQYRKIKAYTEIMDDNAAPIVKVGDRIVNVEQSAPQYRKMYEREMTDFSAVTRPFVPEDMWNRLERAFEP